jgi:RNA polymerase sigma factor (sigma-70 family)
MARRDRYALNSDERSGVAWFLDQAGRIPLLTHEEEIILGRSIQAMMGLLRDKPDGPYDADEKRILRSGKRAKDRFVNANLRLVVNVAKKYLVAVRNLELSDLIQEGMFGLIRGVEKFDPERGYKASTYCYWWIRQGVSRAISQQDRCIRLPINAIECLNKVRNWAPVFLEEHGRAPSFEECAEHCGVTPIVMRRYLMHSTGVGSLDQTARNDEHSSELIDLVVGTEASPMDVMELDDGMEKVQTWMSRLTDKESTIITLMYGLDGEGDRVGREVSEALGCSRQAVQQAAKKAMNRMRLQAYGAAA